eukprot:SAG31_NODE_1737_length_7402_cov_28.696289_7_plen_140_part_00
MKSGHVAVLLFAQMTTAKGDTGAAAASKPGQLVLCDGAPRLPKWVAPLPGVGAAAAVPIKSATGQCVSLIKDAPLSCDPRGAGCLGLGNCATAPKFRLVTNGNTVRTVTFSRFHGTFLAESPMYAPRNPGLIEKVLVTL